MKQKQWSMLLAKTAIVGMVAAAVPTTRITAAPVVMAPSQVPVPEVLSVDNAVQIGLKRNPQTAAAMAGIQSAEATYRSNAAFTPVDLGLTRVMGSSTAPTLDGTTVDTYLDLGDTFDTSGQRRFLAAGSKAQANSVRQLAAETRISLTQQIRDAYWTLAAARAQTQVAQENLSDVERVYGYTQTQFKAGASPQIDVIRSSVDMANSQQTLLQARSAEKSALDAFNTLLGQSAMTPVTLADSLATTDTPPTLMENVPDLATLTQMALSRRPAVQAGQALVVAANYTIKQTRASRYPDVSLDYERSVQLPIQAVVIGVRVPLLDFGGIGQSIKAAEASKMQAQAQLTQVEQQVEQQVAQACTDWQQAQAAASSYQKDILAPSVNLLNMAQLGYKQGATGILPVIDAETTLRNARSGYIDNILALYKARDEMEAAIGSLPPPIVETTIATNIRPAGGKQP